MKDEQRNVKTNDPKELRAQEPSLARKFLLNSTWEYLAKKNELRSNRWPLSYWEGYEVL